MRSEPKIVTSDESLQRSGAQRIFRRAKSSNEENNMKIVVIGGTENLSEPKS